VLLLESDCTPQRLYDEVRALLEDPTRQEAMRAGLRSQAVMDSAERICDILEELIAAK
jgi:UDP-N-acetylglucosamine:LPS N-acetylglucosamine transferase